MGQGSAQGGPFNTFFCLFSSLFNTFSASILHVSNQISSYFPLESSEGCSTAGGATDREDLQGALLVACAERQGHGSQLGDVVPSQGRRRARPHGISMVFIGFSICVSKVLKSFSKLLVGFFTRPSLLPLCFSMISLTILTFNDLRVVFCGFRCKLDPKDGRRGSALQDYGVLLLLG